MVTNAPMQSLYETTVVIDRAADIPAGAAAASDNAGVSSKTGVRYLVLAIVVTIVSILHFNLISLACSIPAIIYATKVRAIAIDGNTAACIDPCRHGMQLRRVTNETPTIARRHRLHSL